jgi:hypothetical protein
MTALACFFLPPGWRWVSFQGEVIKFEDIKSKDVRIEAGGAVFSVDNGDLTAFCQDGCRNKGGIGFAAAGWSVNCKACLDFPFSSFCECVILCILL